MPRFTTVLAIMCLLCVPLVASGGEWGSHLLDPVTTYTNGMPLASSTPLRSHNVYYQCDLERVGCCGGRYNLPCMNSLLYPNSCATGRCGMQDAWEDQTGTGIAVGVEGTRFEELGTIVAPGVGAAAALGGAAPPAPPNPGLLQRLLP